MTGQDVGVRARGSTSLSSAAAMRLDKSAGGHRTLVSLELDRGNLRLSGARRDLGHQRVPKHTPPIIGWALSRSINGEVAYHKLANLQFPPPSVSQGTPNLQSGRLQQKEVHGFYPPASGRKAQELSDLRRSDMMLHLQPTQASQIFHVRLRQMSQLIRAKQELRIWRRTERE